MPEKTMTVATRKAKRPPRMLRRRASQRLNSQRCQKAREWRSIFSNILKWESASIMTLIIVLHEVPFNVGIGFIERTYCTDAGQCGPKLLEYRAFSIAFESLDYR